jgi:hypothetical protein
MSAKILFVAMQNSSHTARWINLIAGEGWDLHLFPINWLPVIDEMPGIAVHRPMIPVHPRKILKTLLRRARNWVVGRPAIQPGSQTPRLSVQPVFPLPILSPAERFLGKVLTVRTGESDKRAPVLYGPQVLARLIRGLKPDLIHSMEFQNCGYVVLRAKELAKGMFPPWLATNWGSDIYYYRNFPDHRQQISRLLRNIDYYSCECIRDVALARELGLMAKVVPVMPNAGGFDIEDIGVLRKLHRPSCRRLIMVKGYQHFAGRALTALAALERCGRMLDAFHILVFSASRPVINVVRKLRKDAGWDIHVLPYSSHQGMLQMFGKARVYLGISVSDAISTSMLEAMALGAFPIQTNTSCCDEWITDGEGGFIVDPDDVEGIAECIRMALTDDKLVDRAAELNWATVRKRLDQRKVARQVHDLYERIFEDISKRMSNRSRDYDQRSRN